MTWKNCDCDCCRAVQAKINRLQAAVNALGQQVCQFHDTNPLNETVVELEKIRDALNHRVSTLYGANLRLNNTVVALEKERDALEAENRVVRELVEDALDRLWRYDKEGYQLILDHCTWMMGEEMP